MYKTKVFQGWLAVILAGAFLMGAAGLAGAAEEVADAKRPTLLPTNFFYFLKEWKRDVSQTFTRDKVKKAGKEMVYLEEIAREIETLAAVGKTSSSSLGKAALKYEERLAKLDEKIKAIDVLEKNEGLDELMNQLVGKSIRQYEKLADWRYRYDYLGKQWEDLEKKWGSVNVFAAETLDNNERFAERLQTAFPEAADPVADIRFAGALDALGRYLSSEARETVLKIKTDVAARLEGHLLGRDDKNDDWRDELEESFRGDKSILKIFDELKENFSDSNLKSSLNEVKIRLLGNATAVNPEEWQAKTVLMIEEIYAALKEIEVGGKKDRAVSELLDKARLQADQAEKLLSDGDAVRAFVQASAALAALELARGEDLVPSVSPADWESLKSLYDRLAGRIREESRKDLAEKLMEAEKLIVRADGADTETLKEIKIILSEIESRLSRESNSDNGDEESSSTRP